MTAADKVTMSTHTRWIQHVPLLKGIVVFAMIIGGCVRPNPDFCDDNADCKNGQICNTDNNRCIAEPPSDTCTADAECPAERPVCGDDSSCRGCIANDECSSGVCRADGTCEPAERILYVRPNGLSTGICTATDACEFTYAVTLLSSERGTLLLADGSYTLNSALVVQQGAQVTVVGSRAAVIERSGVGAAVEVMGAGSKAHLRGISLRRGVTCFANSSLDVTDVAFNNPGSEPRPWIAVSSCSMSVRDSELSDGLESGIYVTAGDATVVGTTIERTTGSGIEVTAASLSVQTSTITRSRGYGIVIDSGVITVARSIVSYNRLGGIRSTVGPFDIVNNFVVRNGDPGLSSFGGMHLSSDQPSSRVQHNTVMYNDSDVNVTPVLSGGLYCRIGVQGRAYGNLIAQNYRGNTSLPNAQTGGSCDFTNSLVAENPIAPINFGCIPGSDLCRLSAAGAAIDRGTSLGVTEDFDGELRSDGKPDIGADEYHP